MGQDPCDESRQMTHKNAATVQAEPLLTFENLPHDADTDLVEVRIARTGKSIGTITWVSEFRQYAFRAQGAYTRGILQEISRKLHRLMATWRKAHPNPRRGLRGLSHQERRENQS